ncbi:MAG: LysR family transcriptional regulator [Advenella sp.]
MNLRSLDLNLLLVFDAIYTDRSISKAARRLHLSQPTVSNALSRLRERLDDPLFERTAQGMIPTPRAKILSDPIRQALVILERGLRGNDDFDFASAERHFVIVVEGYGEAVVLPRFIDWLDKVAPRICFQIRPRSSMDLETELREGTVDLSLNYFPIDSPGVRNTCVLTESLISLTREDHPLVTGKVNLDMFLALRHVVLAHDTKSRPMIDLALAKRGYSRKVAVLVPHFLSMPLMIQSSDMIATLPARMGQLYSDNFRLRMHPVPLRIPQFPIYLSWHQNADDDAGHRWIRQRLADFCQRL